MVATTQTTITRRATAPIRRLLLYALFVVLMLDSMPGFGIGIGLGLSAKNLFLYFLTFLIGIRAAINAGGIRLSDLDVHSPFVLLIIYAILTWAILGVSEPTYDAFRGAITLKNQLVDLFLFVFVFRYGVDTKEDFLWLLRAAALTIMLSSLAVLVDFLNIPNLGIFGEHKGRVEGVVGAANQYGALLAFSIPVALGVMPRGKRNWTFWLWRVSITASAALLIATGSRGSYVAVLGSAIIGVYYLRNYLNMAVVARYAFAAFVMVIGLTVFLIIYYPDLLAARLQSTATGSIEDASAGRIQIWTATLKVMLEWPFSFIVGYGWNAHEYSGIWKSAHNVYLDVWYELGIVGVLLYLWLLLAVATRVMRVLRMSDADDRRVLLGFTFGFLAVCVAISFVLLPQTWPYVWAITGLVMGLESTLRKNGTAERTRVPRTQFSRLARPSPGT